MSGQPIDREPLDVQDFLDRPAAPAEPPVRVMGMVGRAVEAMLEEHERRFHTPEAAPARAIRSVTAYIHDVAADLVQEALRDHLAQHHAIVTLEDLVAQLEAQP